MSERPLLRPLSGPVTGTNVELNPARAPVGSINARATAAATTEAALRTTDTPGRCYASSGG